MKRNLFLLLGLIIVNQSFAADRSLVETFKAAVANDVKVYEDGESYTRTEGFTKLFQQTKDFLNQNYGQGEIQFISFFEYVKSLSKQPLAQQLAQKNKQLPTIQALIQESFFKGSRLQKGTLCVIVLLTVYGGYNVCANLKNRFLKKKSD